MALLQESGLSRERTTKSAQGLCGESLFYNQILEGAALLVPILRTVPVRTIAPSTASTVDGLTIPTRMNRLEAFGGVVDYSNPAFKMMVMSGADAPLRAAVLSSCGTFPANAAQGMLELANGNSPPENFDNHE